MILNIILIIIAYLLGSIPSAVWIGKRFYGIDVREHGSRNAGATNTLRVLGNRAALIVFAMDIAKGFAAVTLAHFSTFEGDALFDMKIALVAAAVLGHIFPVFAGFKGGKGVATLAGAVLGVYPGAVGLCLATFIVVFVITHYVSLGSMIAGVMLPVYVAFVFGERSATLIVFCCVVSVLLIYTHRKNIVRLIHGSESKIYLSAVKREAYALSKNANESELKEKDKKEMVKQRYNELALVKDPKALKKCCCNPAMPSKKVFTIMSEDYSDLNGYEPDADLGVGCGLPTRYAGIRQGDTVVDLGSGAGNDCFIAREEVGETGRVIGIDFAPNMLSRARANAQRRGFANVEFVEGDIENMPLPDGTADVIVSNCVLNLLPRKDKIFNEIYRVLKPGAHFCVSDVVLNGVFPKAFTDSAAMYAGCIASAIQREDYLAEIERAGFADIAVRRTKTVVIPDDVLEEHLDAETIRKYKEGNVGIYSITVTGTRP